MTNPIARQQKYYYTCNIYVPTYTIRLVCNLKLNDINMIGNQNLEIILKLFKRSFTFVFVAVDNGKTNP